MPTITTSDGAELYYEEAGGDGSPLLFVGGWCMSTPWWREQVPAFESDHRVVAMDPRAYGESENVTYGHRMARHAADVRDLLDALDLEDVTAVGWSLAANTLLCYYELFGEHRLRGIVHVDQSPYCLNTDEWDGGFGTAEEAREFMAFVESDPEAGANALVDQMFTDPPSDADREWMIEEMLKIPTDSALALLWNHLNADWRDMVHTVDLPVLVLTGRRSELFSWESGAWLAEHLPNAEQVVFEDSGHCPFLEEPVAFNDAVRSFLE